MPSETDHLQHIKTDGELVGDPRHRTSIKVATVTLGVIIFSFALYILFALFGAVVLSRF